MCPYYFTATTLISLSLQTPPSPPTSWALLLLVLLCFLLSLFAPITAFFLLFSLLPHSLYPLSPAHLYYRVKHSIPNSRVYGYMNNPNIPIGHILKCLSSPISHSLSLHPLTHLHTHCHSLSRSLYFHPSLSPRYIYPQLPTTCRLYFPLYFPLHYTHPPLPTT